MRDPTGTEPSSLLDPPLEGPGGNAGLSFDTLIPFHGNGSLRHGNILASVSSGVLSFYRISTSSNGTESLDLLTSEYTDTKTLTARFYRQDFRANSFAAEFSFSSDPDEQFYGAGQQACCKDNTVNKKGQVVDLLNFNSQVTLPIYMSNKVSVSLMVLNLLALNSRGRAICNSSICQVKAELVRELIL